MFSIVDSGLNKCFFFFLFDFESRHECLEQQQRLLVCSKHKNQKKKQL